MAAALAALLWHCVVRLPQVLSNTYHLHVQPGSEAIRDMGGLQRATNWRGPMLTDSGGYQVCRERNTE
jgi:tRNA-guanine family transglycosylase